MNADGLEQKASKDSAKDMLIAVQDIYNVELLRLSKDKWVKQIERIKNNSICLLATHGDFGENGSLQKMLEVKKIVHTHSAAVVCGILLNKHLSKLVYKSLGIKTPPWYFDGKIYGKSVGSQPITTLVKKPLFGGSKAGIRKVKKVSKKTNNLNIYEEYIAGSAQISVGVLGSGKNILALAPLAGKRDLFSIGKFHIDDIKISQAAAKKCEDRAKQIHIALGCRGITKTDFLLGRGNTIWAIETDAIPGLSKNNAVSVSANKLGISYNELIKLIIEDAYVE